MRIARRLGLTVLVTGALALATAQAQEIRTVQINGHAMRVRTSGLADRTTRQPVIVFQSGGRSSIKSWEDVFESVAALGPVVAYDRPGLGESEWDGKRPTPQHVSTSLRQLLAELGAHPPYVLVGHSWGGPLNRWFASEFPDDVAGMVYVDPTDFSTEEDLIAWTEGRGITVEDTKLWRPEGLAAMTPSHRAEMDVVLEQTDSYFKEFYALPPMVDVPVVVLMGARFDSDRWKQEAAFRPLACEPRECDDLSIGLRARRLRVLAQEVSQGIFMLASNAGHYVQRDDPDLVIWAIRRVLGR